jgi:hypothetical protein
MNGRIAVLKSLGTAAFPGRGRGTAALGIILDRESARILSSSGFRGS